MEFAFHLDPSCWRCHSSGGGIKRYVILEVCTTGADWKSPALSCRGGIVSTVLASVTLEVSNPNAYLETMSSTSFKYVFKPGHADQDALLLLHGTGGNENDLIGLGDAVGGGRALLSPRGQVLENGMPRFFKRLAEGVFDEADVIARAHELADFTLKTCEEFGFGPPIALGFSNGANIAAAMLLLRPEALSGAVLLRAMAPLKLIPVVNLASKPILLISGEQDSMIPLDQANRLAEQYQMAGADLNHQTVNAGHGLTQFDLAITSQWLANQG
jgi:phospholipase/carboxylesterase